MKYLLLDKDFEHRDALDLITQFKIEAFLESQFAYHIVSEIWRSKYATGDMIFTASTNHMLTFDYWHCQRDLEYEEPFLKIKDIKKIENHPFQFQVWRFSPKARTFVEFMVSLSFAIAVHIVMTRIWSQIPTIEAEVNDLIAQEQELLNMADKTSDAFKVSARTVAEYLKSIEPQIEEFYTQTMYFTYMGFFICCFALGHITELVYTSILNRPFYAYAVKNILDFAIFMCFFVFIWVTYYQNLSGGWKERNLLGEKTRANFYVHNYMDRIYTSRIAERTILVLCAVTLWMRVIYMLRFNMYIGKLTGILGKILEELVIFFCFYLIQLVVWAAVAQLAFSRMKQFDLYRYSFESVFFASIGRFDFDVFWTGQDSYNPYWGAAFFLVFMAVNVGLYMSLFVAIIVALYANVGDRGHIYHMLDTLEVRPTT